MATVQRKFYQASFECLQTNAIVTQYFEDWIGDDDKLVCPIEEVMHDWAYSYYDKGSYKKLSQHEISGEYYHAVK